MNASRPTRSTVTLCLCLAVMVGALCYQHYQIAQLGDRLTASTTHQSLDELLVKLREVDDRLGQVENKSLVSHDDFRAGQQALSNRIDAAQDLAEQVAETAEGISRAATSASDFLALKADMETFGKQLHDLSKASVKQSSSVNAKSRRNTTDQKLSTIAQPPFTVVGIEHRGGERFLAVGPPDTTQLSQISFIQPGDTVAGTTWRLKALGGNSARFDVAGTPQIITVER